MSISLYDNALVTKLQSWTKNTQATITRPEETRRLFEWKADTTNDAPIQLPLIALRRTRDITIQRTLKAPATFDGVFIDANEEKIKSLSRVPITLGYSIDIYCRYLSEADEYLRNFVFNIINFPEVKVVIPYNDANFEHKSNIRLSGDVQDNSDIPERLIAGQFTRYTIPLVIDDAYMWSVPVRNNLTLEAEVEVI